MRKTTKSLAFTIFFLIFITSWGIFAPSLYLSGHNPENLELSYSYSFHLLLVSIEHNVDEADWDTHYINQVTIWRNNVFETSLELDNQSSHSSYQLSFPITADHNDVLKVTVTCLLGGSITTSITVWDPASPTLETASFSFIMVLCTFILLSVGNIFRRWKAKQNENR